MTRCLKVARDGYLDVLFFADDLLVIQNKGSALQGLAFKPTQFCKQYYT